MVSLQVYATQVLKMLLLL